MKKRILIIDDNEQDRKLMKIFLNKAGYEDILFADNGEKGVQKARIENPDLVIIDTVLTGIDGFETCHRIRKIKGPAGPKIVMITGSVDAVDAGKARTSGADDYVVKTSDCSPLIEAVKKLI